MPNPSEVKYVTTNKLTADDVLALHDDCKAVINRYQKVDPIMTLYRVVSAFLSLTTIGSGFVTLQGVGASSDPVKQALLMDSFYFDAYIRLTKDGATYIEMRQKFRYMEGGPNSSAGWVPVESPWICATYFY